MLSWITRLFRAARLQTAPATPVTSATPATPATPASVPESAERVAIAPKSEVDPRGRQFKQTGDAHLADGAFDAAAACYREALTLCPTDASLPINLGFIALQQQQPGLAEHYLQAALRLDPQAADPHFLLGELARSRADPPAAIAHYQRALGLRADFSEARVSLAQTCSAIGRLDDALDCYHDLLASQPDQADWLLAQADILVHLKRLPLALQSYDRLLAIAPARAAAWTNRGTTLAGLGHTVEALDNHAEAIRLQPTLFDAHFNQATVLAGCDRLSEARRSFEQALALQASDPDALLNYGNVLRRLGRYDEAVASYDRVLQTRPASADAHSNRGAALAEMNRHAEALACYAAALQADPGHAGARFNQALSYLLTGALEQGWPGYEHRWAMGQASTALRRFGVMQWDGQASLAGKRVLLHAEQGLGDTIQFCRYAALVAARGAQVILEVQPALVALCASLAGVTKVVAAGDALPAFDLHCPLMSLPGAFGTTLRSIPASAPYLHAAEPGTTAWIKRLASLSSTFVSPLASLSSNSLNSSTSLNACASLPLPLARPRVGVLWSGSTMHHNDLHRSIPLGVFSAFFSERVTLISLQKEVRAADRPTLAALPALIEVADGLRDFSETAALVAGLDLIISVDTSVAHLAGAMGKPLWLLLPANPDWRWMLDGDASPWYPSARLFRQPGTGDWTSVMAVVAQQLQHWCDEIDARAAVACSAPQLLSPQSAV